MTIERGKLDGDVRVEDDFTLYGMVNGSIVVAPLATLHLHGLATGDLYLEPDSRVELHGMVNGTVDNRGGRLSVFGTINGDLRHEAGLTQVHPKAIVRGRIIGSTTVLEDSP